MTRTSATRLPVVKPESLPAQGSRSRSVLLFLVSLSSVAVVAVAGGVLTNMDLGPWYAALAKPTWNPPAWLFGPVWTTLYALIAVAAWLVAREPWNGRVRTALALHLLSLAGHVAWSGIFFALRAPTGAAIEIVALVLASCATAVAFARVRRSAGLLLLPCIAWLVFATVLNVAIASLNT